MGPKASTKSEGVGPNTVVTTRATAIGADSLAKEDGLVALGAGSFANEANTVSVGSVGGQRGGSDTTNTQAFTRRITNVGDGTKATDAAAVGQVNSIVTVNKGQLDAETTARTAADTALGRRIDSNTRAIEGNTQGIANVTAMASMPPRYPWARTAALAQA